jgi:hypothetical protein
MSLISGSSVTGAGGAAAQYQIERSLRFNSADSAYLNRTFGAGNQKTWTLSAWVKRSALGDSQILSNYTSGSDVAWIYFNSSNELYFQNYEGSNQLELKTTQVFRDVGAWGHLVVNLDTTQATASNRAKLYWNGVQITTLTTATYPSQNADLKINTNGEAHELGRASTTYFNGYLTEINFIDGSALDPTSFGEYNSDTGVWQPKEYTGSYGTNGFYLNFSDNSGTTSTTLGKDQAGSNNWTPNNFSVTAGAGNDSLVDTPTPYGTDTGAGGEVRGNYCTWNGVSIGADATLTNGNLDIAYGSSGTRNATMGTFGMSSGKWYWEVTITASSASPTAAVIGITNEPSASAVSNYPGFAANGWGYSGSDANKYNNGSGTAYGATFAANDVIGFAFDADAGSITAYKNGVSQGVMFSSLAANTYYPAIGDGSALSTFSASANFGQRPFAYTAPSGFKALCTQNLPEPTIVDGGEYFNTVLYTGNGSTQSITGVGFAPDLVWAKSRSNAENHALNDSIRGAGYNLSSNLTDAENYGANRLSSFDSDGFSLGGDAVSWNASTYTYVAWNWKANGAGSSNTAGTISSTVSVSTTSGFSIITYTGNGSSGATVGHGLGVAPDMLICKNRGGAVNDWAVFFRGVTAGNQGLKLNLTSAVFTDTSYWNSVLPSSTVVTLGSSQATNYSGEGMVMYAFAAVAGYSAFGSYTGNGSTDGPFVYTGFRPAFLIVKRSNNVSEWFISDATRSPSNVVGKRLVANAADAEDTQDNFDYLSNGFKLRSTSFNGSGDTMIYMAFASNPFKYSLAR